MCIEECLEKHHILKSMLMLIHCPSQKKNERAGLEYGMKSQIGMWLLMLGTETVQLTSVFFKKVSVKSVFE